MAAATGNHPAKVQDSRPEKRDVEEQYWILLLLVVLTRKEKLSLVEAESTSGSLPTEQVFLSFAAVANLFFFSNWES